jgi:hypothetical protein
MISSTVQALQEAVAHRQLVHVVRREPMVKLNGFPVAVGTRLLLFRELNPDLLLPDGYCLVRLQDVVEVGRTDWETTVERALAAEGRLPELADAPALRLDGWAGALPDLHALGEPLSVDCEDDEDAYFLGAIVALGDDSVDILHVVTSGQWEDEPWTVDHDGITRVVFRSRYIQVFTRAAGPAE